MEKLLDRLRAFDALRDTSSHHPPDRVALRSVPNRSPVFASDSAFASLPPRVRQALREIGVAQLYEHQAEAIERAMHGEDIVLESPTASGKTLCFNIPMLLKLALDADAHAMMIHPMKALSNDQRRQLDSLTTSINQQSSRRIESWIYDGDTDGGSSPNTSQVISVTGASIKKLLRATPPAILLTNPEMLHLSLLGWFDSWNPTFFRNLKLIVLDEIHEYRGYFGTNLSLLMRRFLAKLATVGSHPQLILASATCNNPLEHAERLTGRKFSLVRSTSAMRPQRHFAFINPQIPDFKFYDVYLLRVARAALACLAQDLSTLVFCPSRKFVEAVSKLAQRHAKDFGLDPGTISPFRSGFTADERREIEGGLRNGKYRVVFSTNALEIGIDIGRLDACILAGFPDNVMSAWQRIGRTGRRYDASAYVLFYATNNAMDQFFVENIDAFLEKPLDELIIGTDNEELMDKHIPYLLHESAWRLSEQQVKILGEAFAARAKLKAGASKPPVGGRGPHYPKLSMRGGTAGTSTLMYKGREIGSLSDIYLFREAYLGAIYNHLGNTYRVVAHRAGEVELEQADSHLRTDPRFFTVIQPTDTLSGYRHGEAVSVCYGKVTIFENFTGYRLIDDRNGDVLRDENAQDAMPRNVRGFWLSIENASMLPVPDIVDGLRVFEQLCRIGSPFIIPCDRHDINTWTNKQPPAPSTYLYETVPGGIGIAEKMLTLWRTVMKKGLEIAEQCQCDEGCPRCIHPPRPKSNDAGALMKSRGREFARALDSVTHSRPEELFDSHLHAWKPA